MQSSRAMDTNDRHHEITAFERVRALTERLAEPLTIEDYMLQAMPEASPTKWHLAHVTWFFETFVLKAFSPDYQEFHAGFDHLFNSYYEQTEFGFWPRHRRGLISRPTVAEVYDYRHHVDAAITCLIESCDEAHWPEVAQRLAIGRNHEQQHQELLLTDIKYNLSVNPLKPAYRGDLATPISRLATAATLDGLGFTTFEGGIEWIGVEEGDSIFSYDNESPRHRQLVEPFRLGNRLITNAEYLAFVEDGGYRQVGLWLSDGWARIKAEGWQVPLYWEQLDGDWQEFTLGGRRPLDPDAPVTHVSYYEADAFARWAGKRLPSEAELELVAREMPVSGNFVDQGRLHPQPAQRDAEGLTQVFGDCWEWTGTAYLPYPGYRAAEGALGEYNGKFMSNQMVLRGGSCASSQDHLRATYRNFFYPHERWQFMGIRLAEDAR